MINKNYPAGSRRGILTRRIGAGSIIGFIFTMSLLYFMLLYSRHSIFSLSTLLCWVESLNPSEKLLAMLIIPFYLAALIFGGAIAGGMLGVYIQKQISNTRAFFSNLFTK